MSGRLALLGFVVVLGMGCASARLVERNANGGVVAIAENTNRWPSRHRRRAEELMARQCPNGYVIEHEQEVITGQVTHTDTNTNRHGVPVLSTLGLAPTFEDSQSVVRTTDVKEWRIWFRPKDAAPSTNVPYPSVSPVGGPPPAGRVIPADLKAPK